MISVLMWRYNIRTQVINNKRLIWLGKARKHRKIKVENGAMGVRNSRLVSSRMEITGTNVMESFFHTFMISFTGKAI